MVNLIDRLYMLLDLNLKEKESFPTVPITIYNPQTPYGSDSGVYSIYSNPNAEIQNQVNHPSNLPLLFQPSDISSSQMQETGR